MQVRGERLARLSWAYRKGSLVTSRDERRVAWVDQPSEESCRLVVDGVRGPERKSCSTPAFSADATSVAAWAKLVEVPGARAVSRLLVDAVPVGPDLAGGGDVRFAPTGARWAASAQLEATPDGGAVDAPRMRVFGPGGDLGTFRDTTTTVLDEKGEHVAWIASDAHDRRALFVDGHELRDFGVPSVAATGGIRVARTGPNLGPEETVRWLADDTLVGMAPSGLGWLVFRAGAAAGADSLRDWASHDVLWRSPRPAEGDPALRARGSALLAGSLSTAERAPVACWWERPGGGRWRVACNGEPADDATCLYAGATPIAVSPGGDGKAYSCVEADASGRPTTFVVANGRRLGPHVDVASVAVSDGGHFAYAARDSADAPFFYVVDGRRVAGEWDEVFAPRFSPDGRHVAWGARRGKGSRIDLVLDGRVRARADLVAAPPRVGDDGSASWVVRRGRNVSRISMVHPRRAGGPDTPAGANPPSASGRPSLP